MIKNLIKFFFPKYFYEEEVRPKKVGIFFGTNQGGLMDYLFFTKKYHSLYYYTDKEITKELIFFKIKTEVDSLYHGDTLFLYFGNGKDIGVETVNLFRDLRKRINLFLILENYKKNLFPIPYVIHYPNGKIRIRNDEMYIPSIISIYSYERGILQVLEDSLKEFRHNRINIRMLLLKLQDKFIDLKKKDEKLPEICISSLDCSYYEL